MSYPRLSIGSLFHQNNKEITFTGRLSISTLFKQKNTNFNFDSKKLLEDKYKQRKNLEIYYNEIYKKCCDTIIEANKYGFAQVVFTIPMYSDYIGYKYKDCIEFINSRLKEQHLSVKIVSKTKIIIIWDDLEQRLNKDDVDNSMEDYFTK